MVVGNELNRLFALQDKHLSDDKRAILTDELQNSGRSVRAVIMGIQSLIHEDLKSIKIGTLLEAARLSENTALHENKPTCEYCFDGLISMRHEMSGNTYRSLIPCNCARGTQRHPGLKSPQWNGQGVQEIQHQDPVTRTWEPRTLYYDEKCNRLQVA
jgi:hypothetical protein